MTEQQILENLQNNRVTTFKSAIEKMIAKSQAAYSKSDARELRTRNLIYSPEQIVRIVSSGTLEEKAALSEFFFRTNGLYKRFIVHYATFLCYAWILIPHIKNTKDKITDSKNAKVYYELSNFCTKFAIEKKCITFTKEILVKGAYFGLIQETDGEIGIQELPFKYCRSRYKNYKDIDIVEFDLSFFDSIRDEGLRKEILNSYPKLIQKAYFKFHYKNGDRWIFLPDTMGVYFCFFNENPFFLDLIPLLDSLEEYKNIDKQRNLQALKHILVQKVKVDGDKLVFEPDEAAEMHEGVLEMLADNPDMDVITTYNDITLLDLAADDDDKTEIEDIFNLIFPTAGVSQELFNATTEAGINYSLNNDLAMMMTLAYKYSNFFTYLFNNKFSNKKIEFKLSILPVSYYNLKEYLERAKELASFGYSFFIPVVATGIDQNNLIDLKNLENELCNLDEILKPLQSSYTQSGKLSNQETETKTVESNKEEEKIEEIESGGEDIEST